MKTINPQPKRLNARKKAFLKLQMIIAENIPSEFAFKKSTNSVDWVVPLSIYPQGYHEKENTPLPFISLTLCKQYIGLYHQGMCANERLLRWFKNEYKKYVPTKLDMNKGCIRLTDTNHIPYKLIEKMANAMTIDEWIRLYKKNVNKT